MDELELSTSPTKFIANILAIVAMFTPLIWDAKRLVETYGASVDFLSLPFSEQLGFITLLVLPAVALRYWRILRKPESTPSLFQ
ncbi:MAG: hypothetical protein Q8L39_04080 [Burkholderiales bacterium]|nr:hypothetical protein [Burkholderiales bacterium]